MRREVQYLYSAIPLDFGGRRKLVDLMIADNRRFTDAAEKSRLTLSIGEKVVTHSSLGGKKLVK